MKNNIEIVWEHKFDYKIFSYTQQFVNEFAWKYNPTRLIINNKSICEFIKFLTTNGYEVPEDLLNIDCENNEKKQISAVKIKDYQLEDANRILKEKKLLLLSEQGTGKTLICILAGSQIQGRKLVVAPKVLIYNWAYEIKRYDINAKVLVVDSLKISIKDSDADWIIVSYGRLKQIVPIVESLNLRMMLLDECQAIKSVTYYGKPGTKQAAFVLDIAKKVEFFVGISGTPITNRLVEFYNVLCCVEAKDLTFDFCFRQFVEYYCEPHKMYKKGGDYIWLYDGASNVNDFRRKSEPYIIRRLRKDVLPDLIKQRRMLPIKIEAYKEPNYESANILATIMREKKLLAIKKTKYTIALAKSIMERGQKIVIFSCHLDSLRTISRAFPNVLVIDGGTAAAKRMEYIARFQNDTEMNMICISLLAGNTGITLNAAHNVIINDFDFVPSNMLQAEDRVCRIGQEKTCNIYYIYAINSVMDVHLAELLNRKFNIISRVLDGVEEKMLTDVDSEISVLEELKSKLMEGQKK